MSNKKVMEQWWTDCSEQVAKLIKENIDMATKIAENTDVVYVGEVDGRPVYTRMIK